VPLPGQPAADSFSTSVSDDGRYTVFTSTASDLVPNQITVNANQNVFLYDRLAGTVTLVNHVPGSFVMTGDGGIDADNAFPVAARPPGPRQPVISADGSTVAFASFDDNLVAAEVPPAGGPALSVYLYDVQTGRITLVNHAAGAPATPAPGESPAFNPVLSADGRYVAYTFGPPSGQVLGSGIALYDGMNDTTTVLTTSGNVGDPGISDDGGFVAYEDPSNVYVYDSHVAASTLVSHAAALTTPANGPSDDPVLSHDGTAIAFVSTATDLVANQTAGGAAGLSNVFLYHNDGSHAVTLVSGAGGSPTLTGDGNSDSPALGNDGSSVAYRSDATDLVGNQAASGSNVYEFNTQTGSPTLVSHQAGDTMLAAGGASAPVLDGDGHLVAYVSTAGNLVLGQSGPAGVKNVFAWLRPTGANLLVSGQGGSFTVAGNADSDGPLLARNAFPGFSSRAANLLPGITAGTSVAYFNTLIELALGSPGGGGGGAGAAPPPPTLTGLTATLLPLALGRRRKRAPRIVAVFDPLTGALRAQFTLPFPGSALKSLQVSVRGNQVVVTAEKGHRVETATFTVPPPPVVVSLNPVPCIMPGTVAGTTVATVNLSSLLAGQLLPPMYTLPPGEADNKLFLIVPPRGVPNPSLLFEGSAATQPNYLVRVHVDVGLGDESFPLLVPVATAFQTLCPQQPLYDVTASVGVSRGKTTQQGGRYGQSLTLTNAGGATIVGPISVVLTGLGPGVRLVGATGTAQENAPAGSPYLNLPPSDLGPGKRVTLRLAFRSPRRRPPRYSLLVLAGPGTR
jgi:Tol biopolymer transport system component